MAQADLVPISKERHGTRFWRRFSSYDFARPLTEIPIVANEILHCASAFPIAFRRTHHGIVPVALLSMFPDQLSPFVSPEGRWLATYVPSQLRCHPFSPQATGHRGEMALLVDETSGLITDNSRDEPFFTLDGFPAPGLAQVITFFRNRTAAAQETEALCALLAAMNLFIPLTSHDRFDFPNGLLTIDGARLEILPEANIVLLMRQHALRLIHAHQVSLQHCQWLAQAGLKKVTPTTDTTIPDNESLDGFLCALAQAQENDALPG